MQIHNNVEDLMFDFVEFLDSNPLYSQMTAEEGWKAINAEHDRIVTERNNIARVRRIVTSR